MAPQGHKVLDLCEVSGTDLLVSLKEDSVLTCCWLVKCGTSQWPHTHSEKDFKCTYFKDVHRRYIG